MLSQERQLPDVVAVVLHELVLRRRISVSGAMRGSMASSPKLRDLFEADCGQV
jgi:hypothetical protein